MANYILSHTGAQIDEGIDAALNINSTIANRIGSTGPASYRNKLGNCSFLINQMGLSFTIAPGGALLSTTDLWGVQNSTNQPLTVTIETMNIYSRQVNRMKLAFATAPTSGSALVFHRVENCNTLAGSPVCLSVDMYSLENMSIISALRQNFGSGGAADVVAPLSSIAVSGSAFSRYTATGSLPATTGKTQGAGHYLQLAMSIPIRSTNPFYLVLPQLEEGNTPSPIEFVEDWVDWARCRRRYYTFSGVTLVGSTDSAASTSRFLTIPFPVQMRTLPTITTTGNYTWSSQGTFSAFVQLVCSPGNTSSQATLTSLIADARF